MTIEEKLAFVRKALEMGADVAVKFHSFDVGNEDSAKKITDGLQELIKKPFRESENNGSHWFTAEDYTNNLEATVFFKK